MSVVSDRVGWLAAEVGPVGLHMYGMSQSYQSRCSLYLERLNRRHHNVCEVGWLCDSATISPMAGTAMQTRSGSVLTLWRLLWTVRCGRPPLLLPSCRKLEFRLSALMDSNLAWVNGKSGRQSWYYADAFQRCIISGAIYHFTVAIWLQL